MSMLTEQTKKLRKAAYEVERIKNDTIGMPTHDVLTLADTAMQLRHAADTIAELRNRLTETCRIEKYDADPHGVFVGSPIVDDNGNETTVVEVCGYRCSECGGTLELKWSYCPSCGRRVVE